MPRTTPKRTKIPQTTKVTVARDGLLKTGANVSSASAVIAANFMEDTKVQRTYSEHLGGRIQTALPNVRRAHKAFEGFRPSQFTQREREPRRYLAPGENLATTMTRLVKEGIDRHREINRAGVRVALTSDFQELLETKDGGAKFIQLPTLIEILQAKLRTAATLRHDPVTECAATLAVQQRFNEIEGNAAAPSNNNGDNSKSTTNDAEPASTKDFVIKHVHDLLAKVPSPEERPVLLPPAAADNGKVKQNIQNFELRSGASDVTAYHDFNCLQIAFENVWAEVYDQRLVQLGRDLYHSYIDLHDSFVSNEKHPSTKAPMNLLTNKPFDPFTSIDDITTLIQNASMLGQVIANVTPSTALPNDVENTFAQVRQKLIDTLNARPVIIQELEGSKGMLTTTAVGWIDYFLGPLKAQIDMATDRPGQEDKNLAATLPAVERLQTLLKNMRDLLTTPYSFTVYAEKSCNFGILVTYRQKWEPEQYQVGDLVSTIPLAPRETRRYTTKQVTKKSRAMKEIANNLNTVRTDIDTTGRSDRDIVNRAENRTNFKVTADGSFGVDADKIHATAEGGGDSAKISETTKKDFHEAVLKSAHEYKQDNRTEVETTTSEETETTSYNEIQNPNDELTVTYLFYELQRTYRISEQIHQVTPVVLVANKVPAPHEIGDAWLIKNDWILRRVLLDDSFRSALDYLTKSFVGDELNLQILDNNVSAQRQVVDAIKAQVAAQISLVQAAQSDLNTKMDVGAGTQLAGSVLDSIKNVFDPLHITGQHAIEADKGIDAITSYAETTLDRAVQEKMRLLDQLGAANTALQVAVDKLAAAMREHYNKVAEVDRLRLHVKENILYYMQAIWNHEPPDQRYFRVFETNVLVPVLKEKSTNKSVPLQNGANPIADILGRQGTAHIPIPLPEDGFEFEWKPLVDIADLDEVLGYKGNYAIYRLKKNNHLTLHMMQDYLELSDELSIRDPDDFANYTIDQLQDLATCLYKSNKTVYNAHKAEIKQWMIDRLTSGRPEDDRVIVPTKSLYIEALVGTHPLLEDFKLLHRALDVKKVQGEVRHAELENVRLAARALEDKLEDPDIEKKILIETDKKNVAVIPDGA